MNLSNKKCAEINRKFIACLGNQIHKTKELEKLMKTTL